MNIHFRKKPLAMVAAGLALGAVASGQAWALTPAGTEINNRATVTYEDEYGNEYSAQSNESTVTVAEQFSATIEDDNTKPGAPGSTVYFPHVLTNTGNTPDTYSISSSDDNNSTNYTVYEDINNNGLPDAGEPEVNDITLNAGEEANLVVAVQVPSTLVDGETIESTLKTTSTNTTVKDEGDNDDGLDETNQDVVNVSDGPVITATKSADVDYDTNQITYTLQVSNNGSETANDVIILEAIPEGSTFVDGSMLVNGLLTGTDYYDGSTFTNTSDLSPITIEEPTGIDLNGNGGEGESIDGLSFTDLELPRDTVVSVEFTVAFEGTLPAGTEIKNRFVAGEDTDGNGKPNDPEESNQTNTVIKPTFGAEASDTGESDTDADGDKNDKANVGEASAGSTVPFTNEITNTGNATDSYDLTIENGVANYSGSADTNGLNSFPPGTTFQFWNESNNTQLTDSNGNGIPDTGSVESGETVTVTVRAKLPTDIDLDANPGSYAATMTSTSFGDDSFSDDKLEVLDSITAPNIDLANTFDPALFDTNVDLDAYDYAGDEATLTKPGDIGETVTFPLFVANNSGNSDSFLLDADLPEGWKVTFREVGVIGEGGDELTAEPGATVSSTPLLPAGATYQYVAEVEISSIADQAKGDFVGGSIDLSAGNPQETTQAALDGNDDGDLDYPVVFTVESRATGGIDEVLDAVDVEGDRKIAITPDGQNQVNPGGTIDYSHVISNRGNTTEVLEITTENSKQDEGWGNNTQVFDVDEGKWVNIANLSAGSDVTLRGPDGSDVEVTIGENSGNPTITLDPEERISVRTTVSAPATASAGDVDQYTLAAATTDGDIKAVATDTTEVVNGQVRLEKSAYVDTACDCNMLVDSANFAPEPDEQVAPGECVIWNLEARNEGTVVAQNVTINDTVTEFTQLESASDAFAAGGSPSLGSATQTGSDLEWAIGELEPGATASAQFCVKVD